MKFKKVQIILVSLVLLVGVVSTAMAVEPQYGGTLRVADDKIQPSLGLQHNMGFSGFELYLAYNALIDYNQDF